MQNRKQRNREIEKQLKQRRRMSAVISIAVLLVIVAAISWVVWDTQNRQWIMRFEGERIENTDFLFFRDSAMQQADGDIDLANQMAMDDLLHTLTVLHHGDRLGVGLTEAERAHFEMTAFNWMMEVNMPLDFMPMDRIVDFFGVAPVYQRMAMHYHGDQNIDPDEFEEALDRHILLQGDNLETFDAVIAFLDTMEEALAMFEDQRDFLELVREQCVAYAESGEPFVLDARGLMFNEAITPDDSEVIGEMQTGDRHIVHLPGFEEDDGQFIVIYIQERSFPSREEISESFRDSFILEAAIIEFSDLFESWVENADYRVNDRALRSLS
ncbi:MAG: hypothetical protein FWC78_08500 [Defluviitaleaceae bacterium]|nr:hypothetical protein [Defluviitaleaceae bacterium]